MGTRARSVARRAASRTAPWPVLEMRAGPVPVRWTARHRDYVPGRQFVDEQEGGPFASWRHTHRFAAHRRRRLVPARGRHRLRAAARARRRVWPTPSLVRPRLARTFRYRHAVTKADIETQQRYAGSHHAHRRHRRVRPGRLAPGAVPHDRRDTRWCASCEAAARARAPPAGTRRPERSTRPRSAHVDAVVHLAGAGIADQRWTRRVQAGDSRQPRGPDPGALRVARARRRGRRRAGLRLGDRLLRQPRRRDPRRSAARRARGSSPRSAWRGRTRPDAAPERGHPRRAPPHRHRPDAPGRRAEEDAAAVPARASAGRSGPGTQCMSWISIDDLVGAVVPRADRRRGVWRRSNATAPAPVTNEEFTAHARPRAPSARRASARRRSPCAPCSARWARHSSWAASACCRRCCEQTGYGSGTRNLEDALRHVLGTRSWTQPIAPRAGARSGDGRTRDTPRY